MQKIGGRIEIFKEEDAEGEYEWEIDIIEDGITYAGTFTGTEQDENLGIKVPMNNVWTVYVRKKNIGSIFLRNQKEETNTYFRVSIGGDSGSVDINPVFENYREAMDFYSLIFLWLIKK